MSKLLGICLPTHKPNTANRFFGSLNYLRDIKYDSVLLIHFQRPLWTDELIEKKLASLSDWEVKYTITESWDEPIQICKIRNICADLDTDCKYYLTCDQDFFFSPGTKNYPRSSGIRYREVLDYMERNPRCGAVMCKAFLGGYHLNYAIAGVYNDMWCTNKGLFVRSMKEHGYSYFPPDSLELRSGLEESVLVFDRINLGYFTAKQMNNPTGRERTGKIGYNNISSLHDSGIIENNAEKYIREKYGDNKWSFSKNIPITLENKMKNLYDSLPIVDYKD